MNTPSPRQQRKTPPYTRSRGLLVILKLACFNNDLEISPLGKSLLEKRVD